MNRRNEPYEQGSERAGRYRTQPEWPDDVPRGDRAQGRNPEESGMRSQHGDWQGGSEDMRGWNEFRGRGRGTYESSGIYGRDDEPRNHGGWEEQGRYARDTSDDAFGTPQPEGRWGNPSRGRGWSGQRGESAAYGARQGYQGYEDGRFDYYGSGARSMYGDGERTRDYATRFGGSDREREGAGYMSGYGDRDAAFARDDGRHPGAYGSERGSWSGRNYRGRGPKGYVRSDERLQEDISERLSDDPRIDAGEITVKVKDGLVTLTGMVEKRWEKHHVENLVDRCFGVKDIENRLSVGGSQGGQRTADAGASSGDQRASATAGSSGTAAGNNPPPQQGTTRKN